MLLTKVKLNDDKDLSDVCSIFNTSRYEIDAVSGRYCIDAKSLLGLFLFLGKEICIHAHTEDKEYLEELKSRLIKWEI